jgi:hypothetical protein
MPPRIGELLVQAGACSTAAVREALQNQVVFGGRLGTNLLELGAVTEQALADALHRRHGVRAVCGDLTLDPAALRLLPRALADRHEVVPWALTDRRLMLIACDPSNLRALDELAFATGREVMPLVAAEARVWALLRRAYGIVRELRGIEVDLAAPRRPKAEPAAGARGAAWAGDLMGEAEFDALYGRVGAVPEEPILELTDEVLDEPPPGEPEASPLGFDAAVLALAGVEDRDVVAQIVLRYARSRFRRAVLLTVSRNLARGWVGLGDGLTLQRVRAIQLALGQPGLLDTVVANRAHYLGPLPRTEANIRLLRALGGGVPHNALAVPILALGRVVNVFYGDAGRGGTVDPSGVGELLILATHISQGYEALVARRVS